MKYPGCVVIRLLFYGLIFFNARLSQAKDVQIFIKLMPSKRMRLDHQEVASLLSSIRLRIHNIVENIFQEYDKLNRRSETSMYSHPSIKLPLYRDTDSHHNIPDIHNSMKKIPSRFAQTRSYSPSPLIQIPELLPPVVFLPNPHMIRKGNILNKKTAFIETNMNQNSLGASKRKNEKARSTKHVVNPHKFEQLNNVSQKRI
ncbi:uncharacterized protein LOC128883245 isoform X2 [Hylaeus volcanicus]|uniref:uncharacterized protein LOC128883245 isoform X2 n=1 Tax=Hylaeus volcanicus TaxID=313075 RepID=UPI0023B882D9|nr:uncharacterized protein LOC128883245 isoform X2 [Hylaeus volcanicus]